MNNLPSRLLLVVLGLLLGGTVLAQRPAGAGLQGQYYAGQQFERLVTTRTDPTLDFNWTLGPTGEHFVSPATGVPGEYFSVRWTGYLYVPITGTYLLEASTDDGMRVWIGGKRLLDSWRGQPVTVLRARLPLVAGRYYPVRVEYFQLDRDSRARLVWQLPAGSEVPQPIPARYLYPRLPVTAVPVREIVRPDPSVAAPAQAAPVLPVRKSVAAKRPVRPRSGSAPRPVAPLPPPVAAPLPTDSGLADLGALSKGRALTLPSLYFTQSTATLLPASQPTLNELARQLREWPGLQLEIAGHTDNVGDAALNLRLSEQRARVVRRYLMQQGIDSVRLTARGYGGQRPVADNHDPRQRPRNRRVEVVVR